MNKQGQVTIFIILAILIVVGIIIMFIFMGQNNVDSSADINPKEFIQKCVRDVVEDSVDKMLANGGEAVPGHALMYNGNEHNYLCYQGDYYLGCYNLHPMLEYQIEVEIVDDTKSAVQECFDTLRQDYEDKGFDVSGGATTYSVDLLPGYVDINLEKRVDLSKGGASQTFKIFDSKVITSIYELVKIAREIVNSESQYCNFEYNGYMLLYPRYDLRRIDYTGSKIYRLIDRLSQEEFRFAVRSCAMAPGI